MMVVVDEDAAAAECVLVDSMKSVVGIDVCLA